MPAENDKSQGKTQEIFVAKKYPNVAKIGSTIPLRKASQKAFFVFLIQEKIGRAVARPSGKFCKAIPIENINAPTTAEPVAMALPIAKPTESPSGTLCIVMAAKILYARVILGFL